MPWRMRFDTYCVRLLLLGVLDLGNVLGLHHVNKQNDFMNKQLRPVMNMQQHSFLQDGGFENVT